MDKGAKGIRLHPVMYETFSEQLVSWQVYIHLIDDTNYYIEQIKICAASDENATEEASPHALMMFRTNEFPDEVIEGSPANAFIPQPDNKEQLLEDLINTKTEMNMAAEIILKTPFNGKTKHPGLNYFSAQQWLQFSDMHFRHHWRQKKRIEGFLNISQPG